MRTIAIAFIMLLVSLASCTGNEWTSEKKGNIITLTREGYSDMKFDIIVIDSCEYLFGDYRLTHKGNCKYCEARRK